MASLWDFCVRLSMDGFLLEASAYNVMHRIDGNEGGFVLFQGDTGLQGALIRIGAGEPAAICLGLIGT